MTDLVKADKNSKKFKNFLISKPSLISSFVFDL